MSHPSYKGDLFDIPVYALVDFVSTCLRHKFLFCVYGYTAAAVRVRIALHDHLTYWVENGNALREHPRWKYAGLPFLRELVQEYSIVDPELRKQIGMEHELLRFNCEGEKETKREETNNG